MNPTTPLWRITLLGGLSARQGTRTITRFRSQKYGALLAYLAYHRQNVHAREVLLAMLWPEMEERAARNNLSVALSSLRSQLEPPGTPAHSVLRADRFSVGLNPATVTTDVAEFEEAIRAAARAERRHGTGAASDPRGRAVPREAASRLLRGVDQRRRGAPGGFLLRRRGPAHRAPGGGDDLASAVSIARQAVSVDRCARRGKGTLIRLLAATGQAGAALRQYKEYERLLDEQLGEEPSAPLRALARQIERETGLSAPAAAAAIPPPKPPAKRKPAAPPEPSPLPDTLTFLLTDIEGSTRQWEQAGDAFRKALERHHAVLRAEFSRHGGPRSRRPATRSWSPSAAPAGRSPARWSPSNRSPPSPGPRPPGRSRSGWR
jgi:DNA-binding SARP family transcriptional activator